MKNLYVFNPDSLTFVPAEWWLEQDDPTRAQLIGIKTQRGMLVLEKKNLGDYSFAKAQEVARNHKVKNFDHEFRCPTRRDVLDIQDAIDDGLHDLFSAIGGDSLIGDWCWTCEKLSKDGWFARRCNAYTAWIFNGASGAISSSYVYSAFRCQAVLLLEN